LLNGERNRASAQHQLPAMAPIEMDRSFRHALILLAGLALLAAAAAIHAILLETVALSVGLAIAGLLFTSWGAFALRSEIGTIIRQRRGEIVLYPVGAIGFFMAVAYLSVRFPVRFDMTTQGLFSLSDQTLEMLKRLDKPVHITFFHDPMMCETVELYQL